MRLSSEEDPWMSLLPNSIMGPPLIRDRACKTAASNKTYMLLRICTYTIIGTTIEFVKCFGN